MVMGGISAEAGGFRGAGDDGLRQFLDKFRLEDTPAAKIRKRFLERLPPEPVGEVDEIARAAREAPGPISEEEIVKVLKIALAWTEDFWGTAFKSLGKEYKPPTLVIFDKETHTGGCGVVQAANGPVYCPHDNKLYYSPTFHEFTRRHLWSGSDQLTIAYTIFHEVSHSVQTQLGITDEFQERREKSSGPVAKLLSVAYETQAEFLGGAALNWVNKNRRMLEEGDARNAYWFIAAIGDDLVQLRDRGIANSLGFGHGDSRQRAVSYWQGIQSGDWEGGLDFGAFIESATNTHRDRRVREDARKAGLIEDATTA